MLRFLPLDVVARGGMVLGVECWVPGVGSGAGGIPVMEGWGKEEARHAAEVTFGKCVAVVLGGCSGRVGSRRGSRGLCPGDTIDSFEPDPLGSAVISTVTVIYSAQRY